jgi:MFS superfamily sulfate permease-like transporter
VITKLGHTHGLTLLIGPVSLAIVLVLKRVAPLVPGSLAAIAFGVQSAWFGAVRPAAARTTPEAGSPHMGEARSPGRRQTSGS